MTAPQPQPWSADDVARHVQGFAQTIRNSSYLLEASRYVQTALERGRQHLSEDEVRDLTRLCNCVGLLFSWAALHKVREEALEAAERLQKAEAEARRVEEQYRQAGWQELTP